MPHIKKFMVANRCRTNLGFQDQPATTASRPFLGSAITLQNDHADAVDQWHCQHVAWWHPAVERAAQVLRFALELSSFEVPVSLSITSSFAVDGACCSSKVFFFQPASCTSVAPRTGCCPFISNIFPAAKSRKSPGHKPDNHFLSKVSILPLWLRLPGSRQLRPSSKVRRHSTVCCTTTRTSSLPLFAIPGRDLSVVIVTNT